MVFLVYHSFQELQLINFGETRWQINCATRKLNGCNTSKIAATSHPASDRYFHSSSANGNPTATHQPTSTTISTSLEATESGGDRLIRSNSAVPGCHFRMKEIVTYDDGGWRLWIIIVVIWIWKNRGVHKLQCPNGPDRLMKAQIPLNETFWYVELR